MKLHSYNYLDDIPGGYADDDMVEVQFKNTRRGYYVNSANIPLKVGDMVAVEAAPGHDIGMVSMTGALVRLQMRKANLKPDAEKQRVFRKAKPSDLERYEQAKARENDTMIRSRKIASSLQLNMKIGDVEYQGDGNKAIFYYIADERVDFRQLIKVLAETFKVRIEMKQIGARQEAGRIGGIGPCGRPLCCTTWMTNFVSVSTGAARYQDISLNPQKLAGQCAKLKCCLNFEVDTYVEASKKLPGKDVRLETADATYYYFKADIFNGEITYSTDKNIPANLVTLSAARAWEVIAMNKKGEKPVSLKEDADKEKPKSAYADILGQDSLTRFDKKKKKRKKDDGRKGAAEDKAEKTDKAEKPEKEANRKADNEENRKEGNRRNDRRKNDNRKADKAEKAEKADRTEKDVNSKTDNAEKAENRSGEKSKQPAADGEQQPKSEQQPKNGHRQDRNRNRNRNQRGPKNGGNAGNGGNGGNANGGGNGGSSNGNNNGAQGGNNGKPNGNNREANGGAGE
jgi:cell fate regulator YaaT (PSP1 superfamily)